MRTPILVAALSLTLAVAEAQAGFIVKTTLLLDQTISPENTMLLTVGVQNDDPLTTTVDESSVSTYAGRYAFWVNESGNQTVIPENNVGNPDPLFTYCVKVFQDLGFGLTTYDVDPIESASILSETQKTLLKKLVTVAQGASPFSPWTFTNAFNNNKATAFGLAVWEIINETSGTLSLYADAYAATNDFRVVNPTGQVDQAVQQANIWLDQLTSASATTNQIWTLQPVPPGSGQAQAVLTPPVESSLKPVPEPSALAIWSICGVLGCVWLRRRRAA